MIPGPIRAHNPNGISIGSVVFGRPFVKRFAMCYRTVVCPGCLWRRIVAKRCMDQDETWHGCRPQPRPHCVTWGPSSTAPPPIFGPCLLWPYKWRTGTVEKCCLCVVVGYRLQLEGRCGHYVKELRKSDADHETLPMCRSTLQIVIEKEI